MTGFPATLPVAGRAVVVAGGGPAAWPSILALRAAGAAVTVIAPEVSAAVGDLAERGLIRWRAGTPGPADLAGAWLVVAATGDPAADLAVAASAEDARLFCLPGSELVEAAAPSGAAPGGRVVLVGGGPGDPGLLTVAGLAALREADVIVTDRLAPLAALAEARPGTQVIDVSKIPRGATTPQDEINRLLVEHALAGRTVVRFKGGDNFVFGRGGEELEACATAGVPVRVIPGVTSSIAGPALAGIPVTHKRLNQGFTVVSGHVPPGDPRSMLDWPALARSGTDLVLLMAVATLPAITVALTAAGMPADTPAATVADAGLTGQRTVRGTVATIAGLIAAAGITSPAVTVIGAVAGFRADAPPTG
ncbi:uroporphyrinogen-III C-methyltransferase [Nakamurella deserti]|uniref:uroporphyrinogen-III C-methyltransferase n=1 Tax=Nakamurella deserti TaxID=2164074 RepID=UPI000DBEA3F6|nr:uroporphyrinogen-III C-methyltransferase [Nakamurella deserti]